MALGRKNALFAGADSGGRHWAIVATLIQTARLNGVDPLAWLTDVLQRIVAGATKHNQLHTLLPWAWKTAKAVEHPVAPSKFQSLSRVPSFILAMHNPLRAIGTTWVARNAYSAPGRSALGTPLSAPCRVPSTYQRQPLWDIELFFKWIKQHLWIKKFYGTSDNAVKTQIWIAVSVYVLIAIVRKRLGLEASLYTLLQVISVTVFEKIGIKSAFSHTTDKSETDMNPNQLKLWGIGRTVVITHNKCHETFKDFKDAILTFLREEVPRNWRIYCDEVTDNFRIISPRDFRILA